jgi:hypothetical protein
MAASPAFSQAKIEAERNKRTFGKLITTTPSNTDVPAGAFCRQIINGSAQFTEELFDMTKAGVLEYIERNSGNDFVHIEYNYKQLRRDAKWYREQCRSLENDTKMIRREIHCEWTASHDTCPFTEDEILALEMHKPDEPVGHLTLQEYYKMNLYEELEEGVKYILTVDVSGGLARDRSSLVLSDPSDLVTVGAFKNSKVDIPELTEMILDVYRRLPEVVIVIERNSYGLAVIQSLAKSEARGRLFYTEVIDPKTKKVKREFGINTSTKTRPLIMECLKLLVVDEPHTLVAPEIIEEVKTLERKKNGKIEHSEGEFDDAAMAKAFSKYVQVYHDNTLRRFVRSDSDSIKRAMGRMASYNRRETEQVDPRGLSGPKVAQVETEVPAKVKTLRSVIGLNRRAPAPGSEESDRGMPFSAPQPRGLDWYGDMKKGQEEEDRQERRQKNRLKIHD